MTPGRPDLARPEPSGPSREARFPVRTGRELRRCVSHPGDSRSIQLLDIRLAAHVTRCGHAPELLSAFFIRDGTKAQDRRYHHPPMKVRSSLLALSAFFVIAVALAGCGSGVPG